MSRKIGVIAEDNSDVDVINEILGKYLSQSDYKVKRFVGNGCGKLRNKCRAWAKNLTGSGCSHVLLFHDLDRYNEKELRKELESKVSKAEFPTSIVIIPIEEMEAWLLSDADALKRTFNLATHPKVPNQPETVNSPKEHIAKIVWKTGRKRYLNTIHNKQIAAHISLDKLRACKSFKTLDKFITSNIST